jgi:transcriptional regulator with PAS, ATPase and Fis domain
MFRPGIQKTNEQFPLVAGNLKDSVRAYERSVIVDALRVNENDKRKVAKLLGISLSSLYRKLRELSVEGFEEVGTQERGSEVEVIERLN